VLLHKRFRSRVAIHNRDSGIVGTNQPFLYEFPASKVAPTVSVTFYEVVHKEHCVALHTLCHGLHLLATGVVIHIAAAARPCPTSSTAASSRTSARRALVVLVLHLLQPKHTNDSITNSTTVLRHATSQLVADQSGIEVTKRCAATHTSAQSQNAFPSHNAKHTNRARAPPECPPPPRPPPRPRRSSGSARRPSCCLYQPIPHS
jgi:hypothetical protein